MHDTQILVATVIKLQPCAAVDNQPELQPHPSPVVMLPARLSFQQVMSDPKRWPSLARRSPEFTRQGGQRGREKSVVLKVLTVRS